MHRFVKPPEKFILLLIEDRTHPGYHHREACSLHNRVDRRRRIGYEAVEIVKHRQALVCFTKSCANDWRSDIGGLGLRLILGHFPRENELPRRLEGKLERALRSLWVNSSPFSRFIRKHLRNSSKSAGFKAVRSLMGESGLFLGRFSWHELLGVVAG